MRTLRTGKIVTSPADFPDLDLLRPLAREMTTLAESLTAARSAAEREAQLREAAESSWTSERLSVHVRSKLGDSRLFVLSNREPYSHVREGKSGRCRHSDQRTCHCLAARPAWGPTDLRND